MSHPLESIIGYTFKNPELLETALTHTSYANESRAPVKHNERLEFLGDSVLQIVSADYLFHAYADRPEGDLTRIRASLVSEGALFQFAQEIHLGEYLRLGRGEERCGGRNRPSVVSDAFEALTVEKNQEKHNQILESLIRDTGNQYDVLVLAQASMSVLIPCLADITKPILSSMDSGVEAAAKALKGL